MVSLLYISLLWIFLMLKACHRALLRVLGLISSISTAHVRSDSAKATFKPLSTPKTTDVGAKLSQEAKFPR